MFPIEKITNSELAGFTYENNSTTQGRENSVFRFEENSIFNLEIIFLYL